MFQQVNGLGACMISSVDFKLGRLFPAGWTLRHFSQDEFLSLIESYRPCLVEISKDFLRDEVSLKSLGQQLDCLARRNSFVMSYAGTTDFVSCGGMPWDRYRQYLAVQWAQARFIGCSVFRAFVGMPGPEVEIREVIQRLNLFCNDIAPMKLAIEIDGGLECNLEVLKRILEETSVIVVVDLENMQRCGIAMNDLLAILPPARIVYLHFRNLSDKWIEHEGSQAAEVAWQDAMPDVPVLWEAKTIVDQKKIKELFFEYRAAY
jgi:sugar phosphate isomerase/epimerase